MLPAPCAAAACAAAAGLVGIAQSQPARAQEYLRFPDICHSQVAFTFGSDIWMVSSAGGAATRLTSDFEMTRFPKFSPDCRTLAFTGERDGDYQVYTIATSGGIPRQLTSYPSRGRLSPRWGTDNQVYGWTPDGKAVLFRSYRDSAQLPESKLYLVPAAGGNAAALPMLRAGAGVYSPDGKQILYSPLARDFRTWKRYSGGWAQDLWTLDLSNRTIHNITHDKFTDRDPIWNDNGIFFVSDRNGRSNLYAYDQATDSAHQLTHYEDTDAKWASGDKAGQIVYEVEGTLHVYDSTAKLDHALTIVLPHVDAPGLPQTHTIDAQVESFDLAPNGEHALFVARGDIFVLPVREGVIRNVTHSASAHERDATWSPQSDAIAFISDASGEEELWVTSADGIQGPRQVTRGHRTRFYHPVWAPDGHNIVMSDKDGDLLDVRVDTGAVKMVGGTGAWFVKDYSWSADSRFIAYSQLQDTNYAVIKIWDSADGSNHTITTELANSFNPQWSPDGGLLYFLADHGFEPQVPEIEWNFAVTRQTGIYAVALTAASNNPFTPRDGAVPPPAGQPAGSVQTKIDFAGLGDRLIKVPVQFDNLSDLAVRKGALIYRKRGASVFGRNEDQDAHLFEFKLDTRAEREIAQDVQAYAADTEREVLVRDSNRKYRVFTHDRPPQGVSLEDLRVSSVPREEWAEVFAEVWRRYRDYFYATNMHGHDWDSIRKHYQRLLPALADRDDLDYLLGEMIGELNVSHAYVDRGGPRKHKETAAATLGARLELDEAGRIRITHIFQGDNADPRFRSPLTEVGASVRPGTYLLAVNGQPVGREHSPYDTLRGQADKTVELLVSDRPTLAGARKIMVQALESDVPLIYLERVSHNREYVEQRSGGRLGYVYIPDMGAQGLREFIRQYYGQIRRDGLVIDVRGNTGGSVSRMILERLLRPHYSLGYITGIRAPQTYPWGRYSQVFTGEMVMLANEYTQSDGDTIAWTWKQAGQTLIGKRTWGGVIGTGDTGPLLDGGSVAVPQFALAGKQGEWIVEGQGVSPDIEVDYDQRALTTGQDPQLETAISTLLDRIKGRPGELPPAQPYPSKP
ncbi:MAG: PD40 domain-containing protein [Proteobacteria bacterium]|nr:PD40 domain-containing protein [Pseudomonadota bacterium]